MLHTKEDNSIQAKKTEIVASDLPIKGVEAHRRVHPFLMSLLRVKSKLSGFFYEFVNEKRVDVEKGKTVIYAISHIGKFDYEKFVQERSAECDGFTKELVEGRMFRDKVDRELLAVRRSLEKLKVKSNNGGNCFDYK